eukprot:5232190-Alexandrium_andersonii.AAC.1
MTLAGTRADKSPLVVAAALTSPTVSLRAAIAAGVPRLALNRSLQHTSTPANSSATLLSKGKTHGAMASLALSYLG